MNRAAEAAVAPRITGDFDSRQYVALPRIIRHATGELHRVFASSAPRARVFRHSADETAWLYSATEYARDDPDEVRWNECEHISLDASDDEEAAAVRSFWDVHVPFAMASHSDYDDLALRLEPGPSFGAVVHGLAPECEQPTVVAPSFDAFLILLVQHVRAPHERGSLWPFLLPT